MEKLSANYRFKKNLGFTLLTFVLGWAIFTFLLFPNLSLLKITLFPEGKFDAKPVMQIMHSARVVRALIHSFVLAVSLTVTVNVLGIFEILVLDYFDIKGSKWLNIAFHSPLICNGMVLVTALSGYESVLVSGLWRGAD